MTPALIPGSYLDAIGVNIHMAGYDPAKTRAALDALGIKRVRDNCPGGKDRLGGDYAFLSICGADFHVAKNVHSEELEVVNEIDSDPRWKGTADWVAQARAVIAAVAKANNGAKRLIGPSLGLQGQNPGTGTKVGKVPDMDVANVHTYPAMKSPADWAKFVATYRANAAAMVPYRPFMATEFGYTDWTKGGGQTPTPDDIAAKNIISDASDLLDFCERAYVYCLFDNAKQTAYADSMGLIRVDGTIKPQGLALRDFLKTYGNMTRRQVITLYQQVQDSPAATLQAQVTQLQTQVTNLEGEIAALSGKTTNAVALIEQAHATLTS